MFWHGAPTFVNATAVNMLGPTPAKTGFQSTGRICTMSQTDVDLLLGAVWHGGARGTACRCLGFGLDRCLHLGDDATRTTAVSHVHLSCDGVEPHALT